MSSIHSHTLSNDATESEDINTRSLQQHEKKILKLGAPIGLLS